MASAPNLLIFVPLGPSALQSFPPPPPPGARTRCLAGWRPLHGLVAECGGGGFRAPPHSSPLPGADALQLSFLPSPPASSLSLF